LGGSLTLNGRDSKIHVANYNVDGTIIIYSTAEVFTWKTFENSSVLIVYGGSGETHEVEVSSTTAPSVVEGNSSSITMSARNGSYVLNWETSTTRRIVKAGNLDIIILGK
jgi:hypothetical protein